MWNNKEGGFLEKVTGIISNFEKSIKKQISAIEKMYEILDFFGNTIKKEFEIGSLTKASENLKELLNNFNQLYKRPNSKSDIIKGEELISDFGSNLDNYRQQITESITNLLNLTRYIATKQVTTQNLKEMINKKLNSFFIQYKQSKIWGVDTIESMVIEDIRLKLEAELNTWIENEYPSIESNLENAQRSCLVLQDQIDMIQLIFLEIKENFEKIKSKSVELSPTEKDFLTITNVLEKLILNFKEISNEVKKKFTFIKETQQKYLREIRNETDFLDKDLKEHTNDFRNGLEELSADLEAPVDVTEKTEEVEKISNGTLVEELSNLMKKVRASYITIKRGAEKLAISEEKLQEIAQSEGYKVEKSKIYKKKEN